MKCLTLKSTAMTCICIAALLALFDKTGWGWFLFAAIMIMPTSDEEN